MSQFFHLVLNVPSSHTRRPSQMAANGEQYLPFLPVERANLFILKGFALLSLLVTSQYHGRARRSKQRSCISLFHCPRLLLHSGWSSTSLEVPCTITGLTTSTAINQSRGGKRWWSEISWLSSSSARWEGRQRTCEEQACDDQVDWWQTENILSGLWQADGGARRARWGWRGFQLLLWTCFEEEDHDLILELEKYIDSFDHIMMCFRHLASPAFDAALMMCLPVFPPIQHDWRTVLF